MAGPLQTGTVTHTEWLGMPVWGQQEVVDREIRIMSPNHMPHPRTLGALTVGRVQALDRTTCKFFSSEIGLVIRREPLTCRQPDLEVFEPSTTVEPDGYIQQPQLAIEVSHSEFRTKTVPKLRDYESIGTEQVWCIDPERATVGLYLERGRLGRNPIFAESVLGPKHLRSVPIDTAPTWPD